MTVNELIAEISELFPGAFSKPATAEAWRKQFVAVLGRFEGDRLKAAWVDTMAHWTAAGWPKPANIASHVRTDRADGSKPEASESVRRMRVENFWVKGFWMDDWGTRPDAAETPAGKLLRDLSREEREEFFAALRKTYPLGMATYGASAVKSTMRSFGEIGLGDYAEAAQ